MALYAVDKAGNRVKVAGNTGGVSSFNGRSGAVMPKKGDYTAADVAVTPPEGMTATDVQGAVSELFTSVSEGKALIASAVTDKGVDTAADATFQTMRDNILAIETGGGSSSFAVPLVVTAETGTTITAVNGEETVTGTTDDSGTVSLTLTNPGDWSVTAQLEDITKGPEIVSVKNGYEAKFTMRSRLPDGYTELQYIETNSNFPYINTGEKVNYKMRVVIDAEALTFKNSYGTKYCYFLYGRVYSSSKYYGCIIRLEEGTDNYISIFSANGASSSTAGYSKNIGSNTRMKIDLDFMNKTVTLNDGAAEDLTWLPGYFAQTPPINLPAGNTQADGFTMRLYSFQYYLSGTLQKDLVPCTDPSGIVGVYDLVEKKFLNSANTSATFVAGPPV